MYEPKDAISGRSARSNIYAAAQGNLQPQCLARTDRIQRTLLQTAEGKTDALHRYPHFDKSTVILIELRWTFSMPESRLKSRLLPFLSINEPRRRAILRRDFVRFRRIAAFYAVVIVKQPRVIMIYPHRRTRFPPLSAAPPQWWFPYLSSPLPGRSRRGDR